MKKFTILSLSLTALFATSCVKDCPEHEPTTISKTLYLRPGSTDGQDTKIEFNVAVHTGNETYGGTPVAEIHAAQWTNGGNQVTNRSFIKFTGLSEIPTGAVITGAKLSLYGAGSYLSAPQGNSSYPGSPYNDNKSWIQRAMSDWTVNTITWNTQPSTTTLNQVEIPTTTAAYNYALENLDVTKLVKDMLANSGQNFGFCMKMQSEVVYRNIIFNSSEFSDSTKRPRLVINYDIKE